MNTLRIICLSLLLASCANGKPGMDVSAASLDSIVQKQVKVGALIRTYYEYVPVKTKEMESVPLVIMLHGANSSAEEINAATKWSVLAEKNSFIAVFPQNDGWWRAFLWEDNPDDAFLQKVIKTVQNKYSIDKDRIYLCGYSIGGSMALTYAIKHTGTLAALAVASPDWMEYDPDAKDNAYGAPLPENPLPIYIWRGENETWPSFQEIQRLIEYWMDLNKTKNNAFETENSRYVNFRYSGGMADVLYSEIKGGNHFSYIPEDFTAIWNDFFSMTRRN